MGVSAWCPGCMDVLFWTLSGIGGVVIGFVVGRVWELKKELDYEVYEPLRAELGRICDGYESVRNIEHDAYPYIGDEFHSIWASDVPKNAINPRYKRHIPHDLRADLDSYHDAIVDLQGMEVDKRDYTKSMDDAAARDYRLISLGVPVMFHSENFFEFRRHLIAYARRCDYEKADEALEDWIDEYDYLKPYWKSLQTEPDAQRSVTRKYLQRVQEQRDCYENLQSHAESLRNRIRAEEERSAFEYGIRRLL